MKRLTRWTALVVLGAVLAGGPRWARAQESPQTPPPPATTTAEEVELLKKQVYELNKQLRQLEVSLENDKKTAEDTAKKQPTVGAGPDGFKITSPDKKYELKIGARVAYDVGWFKQDRELERAVGDEQDGTGFRYARLVLRGKLGDSVGVNVEFDFAGENGQDNAKFRDVYIDYQNIPWGGGRGFDVRAGHFREPFSLEELTAVPYRTFNENGLPSVFVPSRNAGIQISDALLGEPGKERLTLALGVFKETDDWPSANDSDEGQGYIVTGRVTGLPYYAEDGRKLVHTGLAYSHRNPDGARLQYGVRPESRLALFRYADPDSLPAGFRLRDARADDVDLFGAEAAVVWGPFSAQGEYIRSEVDTTFGGNLGLDGYYVQGSWFATGEHRPYRNGTGIFDRVVPKRSFGRKAGDGWGAFEVTARWSAVDLQDGWLRAGEHEAATLGLNWYLNPNARITWNYTRNWVDHDLYEGDFDMLQTRFQFDF